ncbi:MAG: hypothetical protein AAF125_08795 [Chloroflexota bacterium]
MQDRLWTVGRLWLVVWVVGYGLAYGVITLFSSPSLLTLPGVGSPPPTVYITLRMLALAGVQAYLLPLPVRAASTPWFFVTAAVSIALTIAQFVLWGGMLSTWGLSMSTPTSLAAWRFGSVGLLLYAQWRWVLSDYVEGGLWIWLLPGLLATLLWGPIFGWLLDLMRSLDPPPDAFTIFWVNGTIQGLMTAIAMGGAMWWLLTQRPATEKSKAKSKA